LEAQAGRFGLEGDVADFVELCGYPHRWTRSATSPWTPRGAELLFQVITAREERASIACASNAPFSEWGNTFTDPRLAAAVVDRLTFKAHIIQTGTSSYRLSASRSMKGAANT
jgi:hypothetical protein